MGHLTAIGQAATISLLALLLVVGAGVSSANVQDSVTASFGNSVTTGSGGSLAS